MIQVRGPAPGVNLSPKDPVVIGKLLLGGVDPRAEVAVPDRALEPPVMQAHGVVIGSVREAHVWESVRVQALGLVKGVPRVRVHQHPARLFRPAFVIFSSEMRLPKNVLAHVPVTALQEPRVRDIAVTKRTRLIGRGPSDL